MFSNIQQKWTVLALIVITSPVNLQIPMPLYPVMLPPPPVPVPVAVPIGIPIPVRIKMKTTTTTTKKPDTNNNIAAIAFPVPVPMPVQFAIPAMPPSNFCQSNPRNPKCPSCPPCTCDPCTPSFFSYCSLCHQKCRCKSPSDAPMPMPPIAPQPLQGPAFPMNFLPPMSPPLVMMPFPPARPPLSQSTSEESYESDSNCSSQSKKRYGWKSNRRKKRYNIYRKKMRLHDDETIDTSFVKPMLSYVAANGDVKVERRISNDEAAELMDETSNEYTKTYENVQVVAGEDSQNKPRLLVASNIRSRKGPWKKAHKQIMLRHGINEHTMSKDGHKKIIFRPPPNKKISNLSVSFQIVE